MMKYALALASTLLVATADECAGGGASESAWARTYNDSARHCFLNIAELQSNRWGWTQQLWQTTRLELWGRAGQCNLANGEVIGFVDVTSDEGQVYADFVPAPGVSFQSFHLHVDTAEMTKTWPNLTMTVAPGSFDYNSDNGGHTHWIIGGENPAPFWFVAHVEYCGTPNDGTYAPDTPAPPPTPAPTGGELTNCETAWARSVDPSNRQCFLDNPNLAANRWGWSNTIASSTMQLELWAGAGGCVITEAALVGQLFVTVASTGDSATIEYVPAPAVQFTEYHLYVGENRYHQNNGEDTVAPGQFTLFGASSYQVPISGLPFYLQAHAVACPRPSTPVPPAPTPEPTPAFTPRPEVTLPPTKLEGGGPCAFVQINNNTVEDFNCTCGQFSCADPTSPWSDRDYRFCGLCPSYLEDSIHFSCPHCAEVGTDVVVDCPSDWEACDVFLSVYQSCKSDLTNGGLSYNLLSEPGWESGSCGPGFCLSFNDTCQNNEPNNAVYREKSLETNIRWRMPLFHKQVAGGEKLALPEFATDPTMYWTLYVKQGIFCSNVNSGNNGADCTAAPGSCAWDADTQTCDFPLCPSAPPPPSTPPVPGPCVDIAPGVEFAQCGATEITSVQNFIVPDCGVVEV
eukprot:Hpha_TRINITY_DN16811_c3_g6::TRINITY_DN16811_c3_g6_i1::g.151291::m.151291